MKKKLVWYKVLEDKNELAEGRVMTVTAGQKQVAISHFEGKICALDNSCPHQGGPLGEGSIENGILRCPWHGWDYHPCTGKAPGFDDGVDAYEVKEENGKIITYYLFREEWKTRTDTSVTYTPHKHLNQYSYIEVPVVMGYETQKNRIGYSLKTGIIFSKFNGANRVGFHFKQVNHIEEQNDISYFTVKNYGWLLSAGINFSITKNILFCTEFQYRQSMNSLLNTTLPVSFNYRTVGVNVGLRYKF